MLFTKTCYWFSDQAYGGEYWKKDADGKEFDDAKWDGLSDKDIESVNMETKSLKQGG